MSPSPAPAPMASHGDLPAGVEAFVSAELGRASLAYLVKKDRPQLLGDAIEAGTPMEDAVLRLLHAAIKRDRNVANEFLAFFFYDLHKLGKFSMSSSSRLRRFLDTGDLVHSVIGDIWTDIPDLKFESRHQFLQLFAQRMGWKVVDKARRLSTQSRREDRRVFVQPESLEQELACEEIPDKVIHDEERDRLALVLLRMSPRDRDLLKLRILGYEIQDIAEEMDMTYDTARKAVSRALGKARKLAEGSDKRRPALS